MWIRAVGWCLLTALGAQVRLGVPGTDVPLTLQALCVLVAGLTLPPRGALAAMLLYVALGTAGLPVFAAQSMGVWGPTGGYLVGFAALALVASTLSGAGRASFVRLVGAGLVAMTVLFACGVAWRVIWTGGNVGWAISTGFMPFAGKAAVEVVLAATAAGLLRRGGTRGSGFVEPGAAG